MASGIAEANLHAHITEDVPELEGEEEGYDEELEGEEEEDEEDEEGEEDDDEDYAPPGLVSVPSESEDPNANPTIVVSDEEQMPEGAPRRQSGEGTEVVREGGVSQRAGDEAPNVAEDPGNEQRFVGTGGGAAGKERGDENSSGRSVHGDMDVSLPGCPICMERWTCEGFHRVCCIPCGHVYGRSCLESWVKRCGNTFAKCPQCKKRFKTKDIINLYAPQIAVVNDDLEKEVCILREKNEFLNVERKKLLEEVCKLKEDDLGGDLTKLKRPCVRPVSSGVTHINSSNFINETHLHPAQVFFGPSFTSQPPIQGSHFSSAFILQDELELNGARVLDIDASSQILLVSGKSYGWRGGHVLSKISLLCPSARQSIQLPDDTGTAKDLHFAPANTVLPGRLALLASLGKKLSIFSMESNNVVLKYNLPSPSWSCSWDTTSPHHIYAGLQNGTILMFDVRQTARPLEARAGVSNHPMHTIHSLAPNELHTARTLLTASSSGVCLWDVGGYETSPFLLPETQDQGVCISLACSSTGGDIVASFRPKVETNTDGSQSSQNLSPPVSGSARLGTHVHLKKVSGCVYQNHDFTSGNVSEVRMSRSSIVPMEGGNPLFVYGDGAFHGLCVWDTTSFQIFHRLKPHEHPILDIKYASSIGLGLLGCVSENRLQVFRAF